MTRFTHAKWLGRGAVAVLAIALTLPVSALAKDYVLTAGKWNKKQTNAVLAAGGTIQWSHRQAGIGVVSSDDPDFLDRINASKAFKTADVDMMVQWQPNTQFEQTDIMPGDDFWFPLQWHLGAIGAPDAWDAGCTGAGARVAVLDGGIYDIHPDLEPNLNKACSASFVPGQPYNTDTGTFWHGTHVAGIVAGADNDFGILGVAPEAELMHVKVLHSGSGSFAAVIGGILYASDPSAFGAACDRADIINMSLGAIFPKSAEGGGQLVGAMNKAVNFAASQGVLVISSAGNNGIDMRDFPSFTHVPSDSGSGLSISATGPLGWALGATDFDRPASYSNYGNGTVFVSATGGDFVLPGDDLCTVGGITHFCWVFDLVFSTCRGANPPPSFSGCWAAGTSMAAPTASGVAALIKANNPGMSLGALKSRLAQTADDAGANGHDEFHGHGFVNALRACTE